MPRHLVAVALENFDRAQEVADFAAPASANLQVLAVDVLVRVDRAVADVRVVSRDDVRAPVARQPNALLERARGARGLDDDVSAEPVGELQNAGVPLVRRR